MSIAQTKRVHRARLGVKIGNTTVVALLYIATVACIAGGLGLLILHVPAGWLFVGMSVIPYMVATWGKALTTIPVGRLGGDIDQLLSPWLLGRLTAQPTPHDVAKLVMQTQGGIFFANRFMLGGDLVVSAAPDDALLMDGIWQRAMALSADANRHEVDEASVTVAIIEQSPAIVAILPHLGIDLDDIRQGLSWYWHLESLRASSNVWRPTGGIGRDWDFGFTPLLSRFGHNISEAIEYRGIISRELQSHIELQNHCMRIMAANGRRNVALVGQLGSGKSTLVYALAERLLHPGVEVPGSLRYAQVVSLEATTLITEARGRGELERLVQNLLYEALQAKNVIIFLDDAHLFFEEGNGSVDLLNVMVPFLDGGALRIILALDEQRWIQISQRNPSLVQYLNRVSTTPTTETETMEVLENQAIIYEHQNNVVMSYQALQAALQLSSRYINDQADPGRALHTLEAAVHFAEGSLVTRTSVEKAIEQMRGVKVSNANTDSERDTLMHLEERIHQRMINQTVAVKAVSSALRRARAGVRNQSRPIGTFLFLGPTGVGKTELAKSVAAVYFGSEQQLVRLDLNEYSQGKDVERLIADASDDAHSLTAQIARQPFSVVLLDEIEKAHPNVLDTLLQVLDEGILRDTNNRQVSFRDAVIIATSNAGADRIREHIDAGKQLEEIEQQFTDELISTGVFKPEFLNRFDEIALFRPLTKPELLQVVDLILAGVNATLAVQKVQVVVEEDAKELLVDAGFDPRLGARPMRRIVQRTVENIVAELLLSQRATAGNTIQLQKVHIESYLQANKNSH